MSVPVRLPVKFTEEQAMKMVAAVHIRNRQLPASVLAALTQRLQQGVEIEVPLK